MTDLKEKTPIEYWLALSSVKGLGKIRIERLKEHFGSLKAIFESESAEIKKIPLFSSALASRISTAVDNLPMFREKLKDLLDQNIQVMSLEDTNYPAELKTNPDAPTILCQFGELIEVDESCVAIVGTRKPTKEASQLTHELAIRLTRDGFTVVSGLAAGIDTSAHKGALTCSGKTIAVLGTDVLTVYPSNNQKLAENIQSHGCLLSEHPFPTSPTPRNLVQRNRIISGISMAIIVIEARENSGTLHTARFAKDQRRIRFACEWEDDRGREGTRVLIKDNAIQFTPNKIEYMLSMLNWERERSKDNKVYETILTKNGR